MYNIPKELKEVFRDKDLVESMKMTGEELQILLISSHNFKHRFTKESYIEMLRDVRDFLSKRTHHFKN
jgi:predicted nuclease of predicted toxin-antitoxin system